MDTEPKLLKPISAPNLRAHIEREVRDAILRGLFKPGERLVESTIASQMGVSRAPVREVLSALEREGLVVNIPRRGNFVVQFTHKDIEEIYSLRLLLEIGALRRAIHRFTAEDFDKMQYLIDDLAQALSRQVDQEAIVSLDLDFHECFCQQADNARIYNVWKGLSLQTRLLIGVTSKTHYDYPQQPAILHQKILDAVRARDLGTAERELSGHILNAQQRAMQALQLKMDEALLEGAPNES